ncbi:GNAT superfamily N-acetyltransferase [Agrobacterium vitis]|nr:GNAT superfamily N-acetyltransferase [Agrobacterium vitis]MBE1439473.1 GNAT superfamily N-acetyltransferase [Agrobacterium vitis]
MLATERDGAAQPALAHSDVSSTSGTSFVLLKDNAALFAGLTFPRLRAWLNALPDGIIAVGAICMGRPVGLAMGDVKPDNVADLFSIAVASPMRRWGIGRGLLLEWQRQTALHGAEKLRVNYPATLKNKDGLEALLARTGWSSPIEDGFIVTGRAGAMVDAVGQWAGIRGRLADLSAYTFEPVTLTADDVKAVNAYCARPDFIDMFGPLAPELQFDDDLSLIIRRHGVLVGWLLAIREERYRGAHTASQTVQPMVRYLEAYLDPAYWHSGVMIGAYFQCYQKQALMFGPDSIAVYYTNQKLPRMVALTRRRFAPIADRFEISLCAMQSLRV